MFIKTNKFKSIVLIGVLLLMCNHKITSQTINDKESKIYNTFIGLGLDINENGLGINAEKKGDYFWYYCGAGIGTWGYKLTAGLSYYLDHSGYKSSFKLGYSYASGIYDYKPTLEVNLTGYYYSRYDEYVEKEVLLDLYNVHSINLVYSYNLKVGRKSKFVFSGGYSLNLTDELYLNKSKYQLSDRSKDFINFMAPGGIIIGAKFMIGV